MSNTEDSAATAALIANNRDEILNGWLHAQVTSPNLRAELLGEDTLREQCGEFLDLLVAGLRESGLEGLADADYKPLIGMLQEVSASHAACGLGPSETTMHILALKDALLPVIQRSADGDPAGTILRMQTLFRLVDRLSVVTVDAYARGRQDYIAAQARELLTASIPVVQVWQGIVLAPLIGSLDSQRTQSFMEEILERISETNSQVALVDITGVPVIDTQTAHHLIETMNAVRLLGAQMVLTGVRPAIAQTLVHLGVDLSGMITRPSVAAGLRVTFDILGVEVSDVPAESRTNPIGARHVG